MMATPGELKFFDTDQSDASIAATGDVLNTGSICQIPQGVTESTRIGRKCTIKSISMRMLFSLPSLTTPVGPVSSMIRVLLVLDKQCNGAAPNVTDLLETANWLSHNNLANKGRFRVLYDRKLNVQPTSGAGGDTDGNWPRSNVYREHFMKCNIPIEFKSTTGAIGEITSNNLFQLFIAEQPGVGIEGKVRLRFADGGAQ